MLCSRLVFLFLFSISFYACSSAREGSSQKSHQIENPAGTSSAITSDAREVYTFVDELNNDFESFSVESAWNTLSDVVGGAIKGAPAYVGDAYKGARPYVESAYDGLSKAARPYVESAYDGLSNAIEVARPHVESAYDGLSKAARPHVESAYDRLSKAGCYDKSLAEEGIDIKWIKEAEEFTHSSNDLLDEYGYVLENKGRKMEKEEVMSSIYLDKPSFQFNDLGSVYKKDLSGISGKETDTVQAVYLSFYTPTEGSYNKDIEQNKDYYLKVGINEQVEKRTNLNNELQLTFYLCNQEGCKKLGRKDSYPAKDLFKAQSSIYNGVFNSLTLQRYINKEDIVCSSLAMKQKGKNYLKEALNKAQFARITKKATIDQNAIDLTFMPGVVFIDVAKEGEEETSIKLAIDFKTLFLDSLGDALVKLESKPESINFDKIVKEESIE